MKRRSRKSEVGDGSFWAFAKRPDFLVSTVLSVVSLAMGVFQMVPATGQGMQASSSPAPELRTLPCRSYDAIDDFIKAIAPGVSQEQERRIAQACIAAERGNDDKAIRLFSQLALELPNVAPFHTNLGVLYQKRQALDKALEEYDAAVTIYPSATAFNNAAIIFQKRGNSEAAENCIRQAMQWDNNNATIYYNCSLILPQRRLVGENSIGGASPTGASPTDGESSVGTSPVEHHNTPVQASPWTADRRLWIGIALMAISLGLAGWITHRYFAFRKTARHLMATADPQPPTP